MLATSRIGRAERQKARLEEKRASVEAQRANLAFDKKHQHVGLRLTPNPTYLAVLIHPM